MRMLCCAVPCSSMSKLGTWGDHITLQAAADAFHVGINIITSFLENCVITISPTVNTQQPPKPQELQAQTDHIKQEQEAGVQGVEEQAMQQLQQAPVGQELQEIQQPTSPLLEDKQMITLWLSFWAEVRPWGRGYRPSAVICLSLCAGVFMMCVIRASSSRDNLWLCSSSIGLRESQ